MIDLIPAFIYAKDVGSRFIAMNAALARNMGTVAADAIGKTDFDFFAPDSRKSSIPTNRRCSNPAPPSSISKSRASSRHGHAAHRLHLEGAAAR